MNNKLYNMADVFPVEMEISKRPVGHGYVEAKVTGENPFFKQGSVIRGHEFHYSKPSDLRNSETVMKIHRGHGIDGKVDGMIYKNVFAAYTHIHALGTPGWAEAFVCNVLRRDYGNGLSDMQNRS